MAQQIGGLFFSLSVDTSGVTSGVGRAATVTERGMGRIARSAGLAEASIRRTNRSLARPLRPFSLIAAARAFDTTAGRAQLLRGSMIALTGAFGGFSAALGANVVLRYADSFTSLKNQLRVVSRDAGDLAAQFEAVEDVSIRSRAGLRETAILYSRLRKAAPTESAQQILNFTETIQKSLQLGGATAQEAASAAIQFSQAIASNRLGGEELRAVLETPLGLELARGLGITIGRFRELGKAGELTTDVLFSALEKRGPAVARQFNQSIRTFDQAVTIADSQLTSYVGKLNESVLGTQILGSAVLGLTSNLDTLAPILGSIVGLLGAGFGGRLLASPFTRASDSFRALKTNANEELKAAQLLVTTSKRENQQARNALADLLRAQRQGRGVDFADVELGKAAQQAGALANKRLPQLDTKKLNLLEQEGQLRRDLARVTAELTPRQIRSAEILAREQTTLNAALAQERLIRRQITSAVTAETAARGLQTTTGVGGSAAERAIRTQSSLTRQLGNVQDDITKKTESLTNRRIALQAAETAAISKAVNARADILSKLDTVTGKLARVDERRDALTVASRTARTAALTSGQANLAGQIDRGGGVVAVSAGNLTRAEQGLNKATKAARPLGVAVRGVTGAFRGLSAFLGGPLGVAITGAIIGFTLLGARSAKTAAEIERARRSISSTLAKLREEGGLGATQADQTLAELSILEGIKEARKDVDASSALLEDSFERLEGIFKSGGRRLSGESTRSPIGKAAVRQVKELTAAAVESGQKLPDFAAGLRAIAEQRGLDEKLTRSLIEVGSKALAAAKNVELLNKRLDDAANRSAAAPGGIQIDTRLDDAIGFLRAQSPGLTRSARDTAKARDNIVKGFKAGVIQVNSDVDRIVDLQARINAGLRRSGREFRRSFREVSEAQERGADVIRSLADRSFTETQQFAGLVQQARRIRELEADAENAKTTLGELESVGLRLFTGIDPQTAQISGLNEAVTDLFDIARAAQAGVASADELNDEFDRVRTTLRSLSGRNSGIEQLVDVTQDWVIQLARANRGLREARDNSRQIGFGNITQEGSLRQRTFDANGNKVTVIKPTPADIGQAISDAPVGQRVTDLLDGLDRLNETERDNLQQSRKIVDAVKDTRTAFERGFSDLKTTDTFGDQQLTFSLQDPLGVEVNKRIQALEQERDVLQAGLNFKDLTDPQREQSELRIAEIALTIAELTQKFNALPAPTLNVQTFGGRAGSAGGLTATQSRGITGQGGIDDRFRQLLGGGLLNIAQFNSGGTFDVRGQSGVDRNLVQFMASSGETGIVLKQGEHQKLLDAIGAGSGGGSSSVDIGRVEVNVNGVQDLESWAQAREQIAVETASSIQQALEAG